MSGNARPEQMLISSIVMNGDYVTAMEKGITRQMFHAYPNEFEWIANYYLKEHKTPSKNAFRLQFPGNKFELLQADDTSHYCEAVRESHVKTRLLQTVAEVTDRLKDGDVDSTNVLDFLHNDAMRISRETGMVVDGDIFTDNTDILKEYEEAHQRYLEFGHSGIPTGFETIDESLGGFGPGEMHLIAARMGGKKAQPLTANVLTPDGYRKMGDLKVGDMVTGSDGYPTEITAVHPQPEPLQVYRVRLNDDTVVETCGDHLWTVQFPGKEWRVVTTASLVERANSDENNTTINIPSMTGPVFFNCDTVHEVDPYLVGLLLGDGSFRSIKEGEVTYTTVDSELAARFSKDYDVRTRTEGLQYVVKGLKQWSVTHELWGKYSHEKFVPKDYLYGSIYDRLALLQGLMDADGYLFGGQKAGAGITTTSAQLRDDIIHLVQSLGGYATYTVGTGSYKLDGNWHVTRENYAIRIKLGSGMVPFVLDRKASEYVHYTKYLPTRKIVAIDVTNRYEEMQCITVSNADSLYATEGAALTHNSWVLQKMAVAAAMEGRTVQFNALEQTRSQATARMYSLMNPENYKRIFTARQLIQGKDYDKDEFYEYLHDMKKGVKGRLHVADGSRGRVTVSTIAAQIERNKPDIVFIDYLALMGMENYDWSGIERLSADLAQLATQYKIPIVAAIQLNRGGASDNAGLEHIAGSDGPARYATSVLFLKSPISSLIQIRCLKSRNTGGDFDVYARFEPDHGVFREVSYETAEAMLEDEGQELDTE